MKRFYTKAGAVVSTLGVLPPRRLDSWQRYELHLMLAANSDASAAQPAHPPR